MVSTGGTGHRPRITEAQFQSAVIDLARYRGWLVNHTRPALTRRGKWSTPVQGDVGFPDLVLCRKGVVIHAELKTETGRLTAAQLRWAAALGDTWRLWRPSDLPEITRELM